MAVIKTIPISSGNNVNNLIDGAYCKLQLLGYEVVPSVVSTKTATLNARKNCGKLQSFLGLSAEAKATVMVIGDMVEITLDNDWTSKGLAIALGWILLFIPTVTGIMGVMEQKKLADNIFSALEEAAKTSSESCV